MPEAIFFYAFAGLMVAAALALVLCKNPIYSVLSLLVVMFCIASLFIMLQAYFLAAIQVLLYAGAVLVLFLFVIMLLNLGRENLIRAQAFSLRTIGGFAAIFLLLHFIRIFSAHILQNVTSAESSTNGGVESIGRLLFGAYLLPFELASFLILAAIIGAVTLARRGNAD